MLLQAEVKNALNNTSQDNAQKLKRIAWKYGFKK